MEEVEKRIVHSNELFKLKKQEEEEELRKEFVNHLVISKSNSISTNSFDSISTQQQEQQHNIGYLLELESSVRNGAVKASSGLNKYINEQQKQQKHGEGELEESLIHSIRELINQYDTSKSSRNTIEQYNVVTNSFKQCQMVSQESCNNNNKNHHHHHNDHVMMMRRMRSNEHRDDEKDACISCKSRPFVADIGVVPETSIIQNHHQHGSSQCMSLRNVGNNLMRRNSNSPKTLSWHLTPPSKSTNCTVFEGPLFWETMHKEAIHTSRERNFSVQKTPHPSSHIIRGFAEMYPLARTVKSNMYDRDLKDKDKDKDKERNRDRDKVRQSSPDVQVKAISHAYNDVGLISKRVSTKANSNVSPLSFGGYVEKVDEFTPVPQECIRMDWTSTTSPHLLNPLMYYSPKIISTNNYESRMKTPKTSLKSALRDLESAFSIKPRGSASAPKMRPNQGDVKVPEKSSRLVQRLFSSPVKRRPHELNSAEANLGAIRWPDLKHLAAIDSQDRETVQVSRTCANVPCESNAIGYVAQVSPSTTNNSMSAPSRDMDLVCKSFLQGSRSVHSSSVPSHGGNNTLLNHDEYFSTTRRFKDYNKTMCGPNSSKSPAIQCYLRCIVKDQRDGIPLYTLSRNDSEEVLLARACDFEENISLSKRVCRGMYTFHSGRCTAKGWRSWMKKENKAVTDLAGKMQVTTTMQCESSMSMPKTNTHSMVSEFVLFGIGARAQSNITAPARSQSLRLVSNNVNIQMQANPSGHDHATCASHLSDSELTDLEEASLTFPSSLHQELAAIVIEMPIEKFKSRPSARVNRPLFDGTSVETSITRHVVDYRNIEVGPNARANQPYLNDARIESNVTRQGIGSNSRHGRSVESNITRHEIDYRHDYSGPNACGNHRPRLGIDHRESVTVMLPREQVHHGLPDGRVCRPASLIDRWRYGGKCDCGGWDLGCGMKVFSTEKPHNSMYSPHQRHNFQPLNIYSQVCT